MSLKQTIRTDRRIAANMKTQLGLDAAIEACKQKKWFGVLRELRTAPKLQGC